MLSKFLLWPQPPKPDIARATESARELLKALESAQEKGHSVDLLSWAPGREIRGHKRDLDNALRGL